MSSRRVSETRLVIARRRVARVTSAPSSRSAAIVWAGTTPNPMPARIPAITAWTLSTASATSSWGGDLVEVVTKPPADRGRARVVGDEARRGQAPKASAAAEVLGLVAGRGDQDQALLHDLDDLQARGPRARADLKRVGERELEAPRVEAREQLEGVL